MSQQASSSPAMAARCTWPPSLETRWYSAAELARTRRGSLPTTRALSSCTAASQVLVKPFSVASPTPYMPSSVSTRTKSQFFQPAPTGNVSTSTIFTLRSSPFCALA